MRHGAMIVALGVPLVIAAAPRPQVFRSSTEGIGVHASVRARNRPVAGLTAADFEVLDNGVPQKVSAVAIESVPLDLTLVLDTSGSVAEAFAQLTRDVEQVSALLKREDRLRLLTFATTVKEALPLDHPGNRPPTVPAVGATAFFHAILAAMLPQSVAGRPHLIAVLSDGDDNVSLLDHADIREIARRTDAVLHVLVRSVQRPRSNPVGWMPFDGPRDLDMLRAAAADTGGGLRRTAVDRPAVSVFKETLEEFKASYMLWYSPSGVAAKGWHDLTVRVKSGNYTVHARRGYFSG